MLLPGWRSSCNTTRVIPFLHVLLLMSCNPSMITESHLISPYVTVDVGVFLQSEHDYRESSHFSIYYCWRGSLFAIRAWLPRIISFLHLLLLTWESFCNPSMITESHLISPRVTVDNLLLSEYVWIHIYTLTILSFSNLMFVSHYNTSIDRKAFVYVNIMFGGLLCGCNYVLFLKVTISVFRLCCDRCLGLIMHLVI